ncbi:hypothetical protein JIR001_11760 [Polycladomyces abyssicola]|uniref:Uncharacterized protein n=1 Tax=Polycladomyces abyssicola TaxID=1125966 RepID=A0A8D5ZNI4_9BACL|nr:hypothetical protein JIR001_11760 [Polycladomyces abyssicola]
MSSQWQWLKKVDQAPVKHKPPRRYQIRYNYGLGIVMRIKIPDFTTLFQDNVKIDTYLGEGMTKNSKWAK